MSSPVERLTLRLRRMRQAPEPDSFMYHGSRAERELQQRVLELERQVSQLQRELSGPLWSLISVLVALALGAAGGKLF